MASAGSDKAMGHALDEMSLVARPNGCVLVVIRSSLLVDATASSYPLHQAALKTGTKKCLFTLAQEY